MPNPKMEWYVLTPGETRDFILPTFPSEAGEIELPSGVYYWQVMSTYEPNTDINHSDLNSLFHWKSQAISTSVYVK